MTQTTDTAAGLAGDPDDLLTVKEIAAILGMNERYVRNELVGGGRIDHVRLGKQGFKSPIRVKRHALLAYLEKGRRAAIPEPAGQPAPGRAPAA